jgi:exopolysaccharide production protein ExoQ
MARMLEPSTHSSSPMLDRYALVTLFACAYATIILPWLTSVDPSTPTIAQNPEPNLVVRIFVPAIAAVAVGMAIRNHSRLRRWPAHLICLLAYLAFAGASVLWAFRPEASFVRFAQQIMLLSSIVLPAMLAAPTADLMRGMFLCFAVGAILNVFFGYPANADGYAGFMLSGKNGLGQFSGIALLLALHEMLYPGLRRWSGIIIVGIATLLLLWSESKTAFGLALVSPVLAGLILVFRKATRASPAIALVAALICYAAASSVYDFDMTSIANMVYNDPTLTGRTHIWNFAFSEIAQRPVFGWGYQSFWLVGSDAPSVVEAPGWVGNVPNAHNGYYDTILELGYVGLGLLILFILTTLHLLVRVADRDLRRAWLLLSIAVYVILYNCLETTWMHGSEPLWVVFVIVAAEIARYSQPIPSDLSASAQRFSPAGPYRPL